MMYTEPPDNHKIPLYLRYSPVNIGMCLVILIPIVLGDSNDINVQFFITLIWGGAWGIVFGSVYFYVHMSAIEDAWKEFFKANNFNPDNERKP